MSEKAPSYLAFKSAAAARAAMRSAVNRARAVVATLRERHASLGAKIDEASTALKELEHQLDSMNTVIQIFDREGLMLASEPRRVATPPVEPPAPVAAAPQPYIPAPEPFRPFGFVKCLGRGGHQYVASRSAPGSVTCARCRHRRRS